MPEALARATATAVPDESALLVRYRSCIAEQLRATALPESTFAGRMAAYHMGWVDRDGRPTTSDAGKFVRSGLCVWACEACGGKIESALPAAAAIEWMHNFTLIHDDIQDGDRARRSRETVWSIWGSAQGINAGDALHALAFQAVAAGDVQSARQLPAVRALAKAALEVIEGQCLDLNLEGRADAPPRTYLRMVQAKTGALLGASLEIGAIVAGAPDEVTRRFRLAGRRLGMAFQMRDDWLGMWGDPALTGKSASGDVSRAKATYPVVAGYAAMTVFQQRRLRELFLSKVKKPASKIRELLEEAGGPELTRSAPGRCAEKAVAVIARCGLSQVFHSEFLEVARYVANRTR